MKKIMFNDRYGLTAAVLEGRKTQTRRLIPSEFFSLTWDVRGNTLVYEDADGDFIDIYNSKYSRYKIGEIIAVSQSYKCAGVKPESIVAYDNDGTPITAIQSQGWNNKMFTKSDINVWDKENKKFVYVPLMPHQIKTTGIRIERLQEISEEDCLREGIEFNHNSQSYYVDYRKQTGRMEWLGRTPREAFAALIDKVSGKGTWDKNPYVFVYEFELVK